VPLPAAVFHTQTLPSLGKMEGLMAEQQCWWVGHAEREVQPQMLMLQRLQPEYIIDLLCFPSDHFFSIGKLLYIESQNHRITEW